MEISKKTVTEITDIIDFVNSIENISEIESQSEIKNVLMQLKKVDKKKINTLLKEINPSQNVAKKKSDSIMYSEKEIEKIFNGKTTEDIKKEYTLKDLQSMYSVIYQTKASSGKNKDSIINNIGQYYGMRNRAKAFFK